MKKLVLLTGLALIGVGQSFAAPPTKIAICHFDEEAGAWVKIAIPERAAQNHISKHDDALPEGASAETNTALDADCAAAAGGEG